MYCRHFEEETKKCLIKRKTVKSNKSRVCSSYKEDSVAIVKRLESLEATARRSSKTHVNLGLKGLISGG